MNILGISGYYHDSAAAEVDLLALDFIVFYDKPLIKFERLLETYLAYAPDGFRPFVAAMSVCLKEKIFLKDLLKKNWSRSAVAPLRSCRSYFSLSIISPTPRRRFTLARSEKSRFERAF